MESAEPKEALVELLIASGPTSEDRPHFGKSDAEALPKPRGAQTKHVMLSYQWDHRKKHWFLKLSVHTSPNLKASMLQSKRFNESTTC